MNQTISEKIRQRRRQMYVHSYLYYEMNQNIVSDHVWAKWAKELAELQYKYPKESSEVEYYEDFKDWDGSSGAFLNFPEFSKTVAQRLLKMQEKTISASILQKSCKISTQNVKKSKLQKESASRKLF